MVLGMYLTIAAVAVYNIAVFLEFGSSPNSVLVFFFLYNQAGRPKFKCSGGHLDPCQRRKMSWLGDNDGTFCFFVLTSQID